MKISIWDLDWYHKQSFIPNVKCMKISSFHKQKGDDIHFITTELEINFAYDTMYIVCEKPNTQLPPRKIIDDNRVVLIGAAFALYSKHKEPGAIIMACRPDYLLYETEERDKYGNANFVTFYANGKLITSQQDYHNTKLHKHFTIVADKWFWKASDEEIIYCLEILKQDKNLMFFEPISLRRILTNDLIRQKFLDLHFTTGTPFKWKNDFSSENIQPIIDFLLELRAKTKSGLGFIPIKNRIGLETDELELLRCMQIISQFKTHKLKCVIINQTKGKTIFETLETWTRYAMELSFVEYVLHPYCASSGILWYNIINNSIHWRNAKIDYLLYLLVSNTWANYRYTLFHQWGNEELNGRQIKYDYIKQNMNLLYKDTQE